MRCDSGELRLKVLNLSVAITHLLIRGNQVGLVCASGLVITYRPSHLE
jgi:hypothetical protein